MIDRITRRVLWAGIAGPVLFVAGFLVLGATRADYDPARVFVSQLSLGADGWLQTTNFIITGTLILAFAAGLGRLVPSGPASTWGPRAVGLVGLGFLVAGLFVTDPALGYPPGTPPGLSMTPSPIASVHVTGAMFVFGGMPAAAFVFARRFAREGRRREAWYAALSGVATLAFFVGANVSAMGGPAIDGVAGLLQRAAAISGLAWLALLGPMLRGLPETPREPVQPIVPAGA